MDDFLFAGRKGQRVVASLLSSSLDSRLIAAVEVFDAAGRRLAAGRESRGTDALADCTLPADGDYLVRVHDFTYTAGGADHFYRLSLSTAPWIDAVFPPVVEPGKAAELVIHGRNLPSSAPTPRRSSRAASSNGPRRPCPSPAIPPPSPGWRSAAP